MDVFLTSPWIPAEWIRAHGLIPRGIWASESFHSGGSPLSAGVCAFAEAAVRFAETATDSVVIFSTACDQMRRGFDTAQLHGLERDFLFNLPATETLAAKQIYRAELERLGRFLLAIGGHAPAAATLRQELMQSNATRQRLLESATTTSPRGFAEAVSRFHWDGEYSPPPPDAQGNPVALALVGGPFLPPHWKLLDEIEAAGGRVVFNATKTGERSLSPSFDWAAGTNPFDALVRGYHDHMVDMFQRPNTRLYSWLKPRLAAREVRGIVLWLFTGCDLWRAEAHTLRKTFGLPVLQLEADEATGFSARDLTRIQAIVETLQ